MKKLCAVLARYISASSLLTNMYTTGRRVQAVFTIALQLVTRC